MRTFSRWMPASPPPKISWAGWLILAGLGASAVPSVVRHPGAAIVVLAALGTYVWNAHRSELRRLKTQTAARPGESICTFARGLPRTVDPWIVRAVSDALRPYVTYPGGRMPLRAADSFTADIRMDPDDLEDIVDRLALRTGRSLQGTERNPYVGRVATVGDLVLFLNEQPRASAT